MSETSLQRQMHPYSLVIPAFAIYGVLFILPTLMSFFFSLTIWTLKDYRFVGFQNFKLFFSEDSLRIGIKNTLLYAVMTSSMKVIIALFIATFLCSGLRSKNYLRSVIFFPNLVSTLAVGLTFSSLMHPSKGVFNTFIANVFHISGPDWLGNPHLALFSIIFVDVWKGLGVATVIYLSGILAIPKNYYEAASIDGASKWCQFRHITIPLVKSSMTSVIILSFIGGMRSFDLIWAMTKGGPGFATDVVASIIYKQFSNGYFGLSIAGNVIMFVMISFFALPLYKFLVSREESF
ncbi:sugar ABC transporter permease [uncultured Sphaerochaeta sp.]|uniref:carbohydrate ABC transporter permease n=1 Tax=uncultured Sphaerochaeta sp. TaxID=886478 RepID=UPI002A0A17D4|nr:sugar ABC transporter permease [uncultured Sphaerochaeta sp.]